MDMLSKEDLAQIGEEFGKVIEHNLLPALDTIIDEKLKPINAKIDSLPTKDFVTEKIGELRGDMVTGFRKIDNRFDEFAEVLEGKGVFNEADVARVNTPRLYPRPTA